MVDRVSVFLTLHLILLVKLNQQNSKEKQKAKETLMSLTCNEDRQN